ncbi:MAG: dihydrodipicolinate synthase family protein [Longimicrobiales bacterium]
MPDTGLELAGVLVPVTTPFDAVTGEIEPIHFRENLRRWASEPLDGFVLFGSTGEGPLLDEEEKLRLTAFARDIVPATLPLVAGAGAESTRSAVHQARSLAAAGADAVIVAPPSYFGPLLPPAALRDHFLAIADASPVPVVLYNIPKYTHVSLEAGLVAELVRHPNVVGVKDSSGDVKRLAAFTDVCAQDCRVLVGSGALLYTALELGVAGGIAALGLVAPRECADVVRLFREGRTREAGRLQERIAPVHREIVARLGIPALKVALDLIGYAGGPPRPPLQPASEKERREVARVMQQAGLLSETGSIQGR